MTKLVDKLETALDTVEHRLMTELTRMGQTVSDDRFPSMHPRVRQILKDAFGQVHEKLASRAPATKQSTVDRRIEFIQYRLEIIRQLLGAKIPAIFLEEIIQQLPQTTDKSAELITEAANTTADQAVTAPKEGAMTLLKKRLFKEANTRPSLRARRNKKSLEIDPNNASADDSHTELELGNLGFLLQSLSQRLIAADNSGELIWLLRNPKKTLGAVEQAKIQARTTRMSSSPLRAQPEPPSTND